MRNEGIFSDEEITYFLILVPGRALNGHLGNPYVLETRFVALERPLHSQSLVKSTVGIYPEKRICRPIIYFHIVCGDAI